MNRVIFFVTVTFLSQMGHAAPVCADFSGAWSGSCTITSMDSAPKTEVESMTANQDRDCSFFNFNFAKYTESILPGQRNDYWKAIYKYDGTKSYMGQTQLLAAENKLRKESNELDGSKVLESEYELLADGTLKRVFRLYLANNSGIQAEEICIYRRQ